MQFHRFARATTRHWLLSLAVGAVGWAGMSQAHATLVTYSGSAHQSSFGTSKVVLHQFDPALGVLTAVTVRGQFTGSGMLNSSDFCRTDPCDSDPGTPSSGAITGSLALMAGSTSVLAATDSASGTTPPCIDTTNDGRAIECDLSVDVSAKDQATVTAITDQTLLDWFKGTGTFDVDYSLVKDKGTFFSADLSASAQVGYTYDERPANVPEPPTLALAGFAALGVVLSRRRGAGRWLQDARHQGHFLFVVSGRPAPSPR